MKCYVTEIILFWTACYFDLIQAEGVARFLEVLPLTKIGNETSIEEVPHGPEFIRNITNVLKATTNAPTTTEFSTTNKATSSHESMSTTPEKEKSPTVSITSATSEPSTTSSTTKSLILPILTINATIGTVKNNSTSGVPKNETIVDSSIENLSYYMAKDFVKRSFMKRQKRGCPNQEYDYEDDSGYGYPYSRRRYYSCSFRFRTFERPRRRCSRCCNSRYPESDPDVAVPKSLNYPLKCNQCGCKARAEPLPCNALKDPIEPTPCDRGECEENMELPAAPVKTYSRRHRQPYSSPFFRPFWPAFPDYDAYFKPSFPDYDFRDLGYYKDYREYFDRRRRSLAILGRKLMAKMKSHPVFGTVYREFVHRG